MKASDPKYHFKSTQEGKKERSWEMTWWVKALATQI